MVLGPQSKKEDSVAQSESQRKRVRWDYNSSVAFTEFVNRHGYIMNQLAKPSLNNFYAAICKKLEEDPDGVPKCEDGSPISVVQVRNKIRDLLKGCSEEDQERAETDTSERKRDLIRQIALYQQGPLNNYNEMLKERVEAVESTKKRHSEQFTNSSPQKSQKTAEKRSPKNSDLDKFEEYAQALSKDISQLYEFLSSDEYPRCRHETANTMMHDKQDQLYKDHQTRMSILEERLEGFECRIQSNLNNRLITLEDYVARMDRNHAKNMHMVVEKLNAVERKVDNSFAILNHLNKNN